MISMRGCEGMMSGLHCVCVRVGVCVCGVCVGGCGGVCVWGVCGWVWGCVCVWGGGGT